jgi:hypothetical protein
VRKKSGVEWGKVEREKSLWVLGKEEGKEEGKERVLKRER